MGSTFMGALFFLVFDIVPGLYQSTQICAIKDLEVAITDLEVYDEKDLEVYSAGFRL